MREWLDKSVFENLKPRMFYREKNTSYYQTERVTDHEITIFPSSPPWSLLWTTAIYVGKTLPGCHHRRINPTFLAIEYIVEGSLLFKQDDRIWLAEPGDICLMLPWHNNEFITGPQGFCEKISILMIGPALGDLLRHSGMDRIDVMEAVDGDKFLKFVCDLKAILDGHPCDAAERISILSFEILQMLSHTSRTVSYPEEMERLLFYMESHIDQKLTLENLAASYPCSPSRLIRLFREYLNTTPHQALTSMRMNFARLMLIEKELSIKEIALNAGYNDSLNFSTAFRKHFGTSPRTYRSNYRIQSESTSMPLTSNNGGQ